VVALLELRSCTLSALEHAASLAGRSDSPLKVVYIRPNLQTLQTMWTPTPPLDHLAIESSVFAHAAGILAPSGQSWSFETARTPDELPEIWRSACTADGPGAAEAMLVYASHRRGHPWAMCPRDPVRRALAKLGSASPAVRPVDCARSTMKFPVPPHWPHG